MPRELKHGRRTVVDQAVHTASSVAPSDAGGGGKSFASAVQAAAPRRTAAARWFAALDSGGEAPEAPRGPSPIVAIPAVLAAALAAACIGNLVLRTLLPLGFLLVAAAVIGRWARARPEGPSSSPSPARRPRASRDDRAARGLELDGERLAFRRQPAGRPRASRPRASRDDHDGRRELEGEGETLLLLGAPFGVTLLASPRRDRLIALLSSAAGNFYLGAVFDAAARRSFAPLLDRCFTVVGDDAGMDAIGPDGEPLLLAPEELASLLDALVEHCPACLDRFVLTDARGTAITLDSRQLCVGERTVDLDAPLDWKPIVFQEALGQAIAVYQGTWIRQSGTELTLVSLLPALGPAPGADLDLGSLDRAVLRDLRLMQATPEAPPPNEQRVAIDRLFMLQVRSALDRAPRASREEERARA